MTSRRAQRRTRCEAEFAVLASWCAAESDLPEARKATHDALIKMLGRRRRGGVTWQWSSGEAAQAALDVMAEGATGEHADYYRRIRALLREHGGLVVVASARGALVSAGRNECPNPACDRTKPRGKAFCLPCWRQLPHAVQTQVWHSYRDRDLYDHVDFLLRLGARLAAGTGSWPAPTTTKETP